MILQRLISEAAKVPDISGQVNDALNQLESVPKELDYSSLELLTKLTLQQYQCEQGKRRTVNLKSVESSMIKAKHAAIDTEDDFV
jgi:hypothetical protein